MPGEIGPVELAERLRSGAAPVLVDVREPWEREIAVLPGSLHIPIDELPARTAEIPPGPVVFY